MQDLRNQTHYEFDTLSAQELVGSLVAAIALVALALVMVQLALPVSMF